jgi:hypothetical protein
LPNFTISAFGTNFEQKQLRRTRSRSRRAQEVGAETELAARGLDDTRIGMPEVTARAPAPYSMNSLPSHPRRGSHGRAR